MLKVKFILEIIIIRGGLRQRKIIKYMQSKNTLLNAIEWPAAGVRIMCMVL